MINISMNDTENKNIKINISILKIKIIFKIYK